MDGVAEHALACSSPAYSPLIAQRPDPTVRAADLILVVEDGRVVDRGTHDELLAAGGRYAHLHRTQFAGESLSVH